MLLLALYFVGYALIGITTGVLAGLLGISGGVVTVPVLFLLFQLQHFPQEHLMHVAIGTSLAAMVFNALSSTWAHARRQSVLWPVVRSMAPGIVLGSMIGAAVARFLPENALEMLFGTFAVLLGIYFFLRPQHPHVGDHRLPPSPVLSAIGVGIGALSNIFGIGGGVITSPILMHYHVQMRNAVATSAATGLLISFIGAVSYLYFGLKEVTVDYAIGYLYLPAFFMISGFTLLAAPYGAKLSYVLAAGQLKRIFSIVLMIVGTLMIFR